MYLEIFFRICGLDKQPIYACSDNDCKCGCLGIAFLGGNMGV